jgi:hypothetical protein
MLPDESEGMRQGLLHLGDEDDGPVLLSGMDTREAAGALGDTLPPDTDVVSHKSTVEGTAIGSHLRPDAAIFVGELPHIQTTFSRLSESKPRDQ